MISIGALIAAGIAPTQARTFEPYLQQTCEHFGITTPLREACFVAQGAYESSMFRDTEENLRYSTAQRIVTVFRRAFDLNQDKVIEPEELAAAQAFVLQPEKLANRAYAGRNGNGNEASGDGWRYRGRGLFQITGRSNYTTAALKCCEPYIDQPDLVMQPPDACLTAGWYWDANNLNRLADAGDIDGITRRINGAAMTAADQRRSMTRTFIREFSAP